MGREEWIHEAYRYLRKGAAFMPQAVVCACRLLAVVLLVDLLWVGIINQGVRSAVPGLVRAEALARFEEGMSPSEVDLVEASYSAPNAVGVRHFSGDPSQLQPLSRLSRALSRTASSEGRGLRAGIERVHAEYETLGITKTFTRASYLAKGVHDLASCLVLLLVAKWWRHLMRYLYQFVASCMPRG